MEDYAQHPQVPVQPKTTPVFHTRRSVGFTYIIPVGLLLGFGLFLLSYLLRLTGGPRLPQLKTSQARPTPVASARSSSPTVATPSPTEISKTAAILVLNGSGRAGVAARLKDELLTLGFTNVRTGNAGAYSYTGLTIQSAPNKHAAGEAVKRLLAKTHTVHESAITASSGADVVIIVGKE